MWKSKVTELFKKERELLVRARDHARVTRDSAPTANESHSDTTRSEHEKLVSALDEQIWILDQGMKSLEKSEVNYFEINNGGMKMKLVIVPEGMGGKKIDDVQVISVTTPLGVLLKGKQAGATVDINGRRVEILDAQ
ncbi:MAG: hypothetical protein AAB909_04925 [Patescibacteria group bacterium]